MTYPHAHIIVILKILITYSKHYDFNYSFHRTNTRAKHICFIHICFVKVQTRKYLMQFYQHVVSSTYHLSWKADNLLDIQFQTYDNRRLTR